MKYYFCAHFSKNCLNIIKHYSLVGNGVFNFFMLEKMSDEQILFDSWFNQKKWGKSIKLQDKYSITKQYRNHNSILFAQKGCYIDTHIDIKMQYQGFISKVIFPLLWEKNFAWFIYPDFQYSNAYQKRFHRNKRYFLFISNDEFYNKSQIWSFWYFEYENNIYFSNF